MKKEIEVKFIKIDKKNIEKLLQSHWFTCITPEFFMKRKTFHKKDTQKNEWFRVRKEFNKTTMTYKCIHDNSLSWVEEVEIIVDDFDYASEILVKTWLHNTSTQENLREVWTLWNIEACIDTWPWLMPYIEIEWPTEQEVIEIVNKLWFHIEDGMFGGTELVYEKELWIPQSILLKLPEITFNTPPKV